MGTFVVDVLATHRLVRLLAVDTITKTARDRVIRQAYNQAGKLVLIEGNEYREVVRLTDGSTRVDYEVGPDGHDWETIIAVDVDPPKLAVLITCRWCLSVWCAAGVAIARRVAPKWWAPVAHVLAGSSLSMIVSRWERDE